MSKRDRTDVRLDPGLSVKYDSVLTLW